jgi:hypothetical protein
MTVHDVDLDAVCPRCFGFLHLLREPADVGRQD